MRYEIAHYALHSFKNTERTEPTTRLGTIKQRAIELRSKNIGKFDYHRKLLFKREVIYDYIVGDLIYEYISRKLRYRDHNAKFHTGYRKFTSNPIEMINASSVHVDFLKGSVAFNKKIPHLNKE